LTLHEMIGVQTMAKVYGPHSIEQFAGVDYSCPTVDDSCQVESSLT
jgi:hypothetical protein